MEKKGLILIPFLTGYGGTETVINNLLDEYNKDKSKYNINLEVYSLGGYINGDWLRFSNVKVFQFPKERYLREFLYLFLLPFLILYSIIKEKPDFVIFTNPIMWTIAKICSQLLPDDIKIIAWYHYSYTLKPVNKYCLHKPDYYLTISRAGKIYLENIGINPNNIFIVYNPIIPSKKVIKHSTANNKFIYVGRIEYGGQKNLKEMFIALSKISKPWILNIYGTGTNDNVMKLIALSKKLHIYENIHFKGYINDVFNHIKCADALLLTSNYEGLPMVLIEAISHGLYVISSDCPDGPNELITKYNGSIYKMHDLSKLINLLNDVIDRKFNINHNVIKRTISNLYIDSYYKKFINSLNIILK